MDSETVQRLGRFKQTTYNVVAGVIAVAIVAYVVLFLLVWLNVIPHD